MSFTVKYHATGTMPMLGGVKKAISSRFQRREDAETRMKQIIACNHLGGRTIEAEIVEDKGYPEIFVHCGTIPTCIGAKCPSCRKTLTVSDAKFTEA